MTPRTADLRAAYEHCRRLQAEHGRSFYRATTLLPRARRRHVWALYAFARVTDDLVDSPDVDPARRRQDLSAWQERALSALAAADPPSPSAEPVLAATWATLHELGQPVSLLEEFFTSMQLDLGRGRYATWADLQGYMRGSAAVIGELMVPVLGGGQAALPYAGALGEAFQLTNFIRDVREDLLLDRVYLPQEDLTAHGVTEADLHSCADLGQVSTPVRDLLAGQVSRARDLYAVAAPGIPLLAAPARPCIRAAAALYAQILVEIERADHNVFAGRVVVPPHRRALCVARALRPRR